MKTKILLLLCAVFIGISANAQKLAAAKVPAAVTSAFKAKYPAATAVKWELEDKTEYEAEFMMNGEKYSASFDKAGTWMETETEIKVAALPATIQQAIAKQFAGYKIEEAEKVESAKNGKCYEVEIKKGKETWEVLMNSKGEVLKKKMEKEGEDEKDND